MLEFIDTRATKNYPPAKHYNKGMRQAVLIAEVVHVQSILNNSKSSGQSF